MCLSSLIIQLPDKIYCIFDIGYVLLFYCKHSSMPNKHRSHGPILKLVGVLKVTIEKMREII